MLGLGPMGMSKFRPVLNAGETFEDTRAYNMGEQRGMHSEFVRDPFSIGDFPVLSVDTKRLDTTDSAPLSQTTSHGSHFY